MFAIIGALFGFVFFVLAAGIGILGTIFWIWMLIDCVKNTGIETGEKVVWIVAIALTHFIGALIYFFAAKPRGRLGTSP